MRAESGEWRTPLPESEELLETLLLEHDEQLHEVEFFACQLDLSYFTRRWLWIEDRRTRSLIRFVPNGVQRKRRSECTDFDIILKARKEGISTDVAAEFFHDVLFTPNLKAVVLAHDNETVVTLFETPTRFFDKLPVFLKPRTEYSNRRELIFSVGPRGEELNSRYVVGTAGALEFGRGRDVDRFHSSECCFYPDLHRTLAGAGEAMRPGAKARLETTYKFTGKSSDAFKSLYDDAAAGRNKWHVQFFPWWVDPGYAEEADADWELSEEELALQEAHGLTRAQVYWFHQKRRDLGHDCDSEYPSTAADAFKVRGGTMRFDAEALDRLLRSCKEPVSVEDGGALRIWQEPIQNGNYVIGADTSEGTDESDYCAAVVLDETTGEQVASLWGRWPDHVYADKLASLGRRYNEALIAVERNNTGHSVLNSLLHVLEYGTLFVDHDHKFGWYTDGQSRPIMLAEIDQATREGWWVLRDADLVLEMQTFVYQANGKPSGPQDDRVFAAGIALCVRQQVAGGGVVDLTMRRPEIEVNGKPEARAQDKFRYDVRKDPDDMTLEELEAGIRYFEGRRSGGDWRVP